MLQFWESGVWGDTYEDRDVGLGAGKTPMAGLGLNMREAAREVPINKQSLLAEATYGIAAWTDDERPELHSGIMGPQRANGSCGGHRLRLFSAQNLEGSQGCFIYLLIYRIYFGILGMVQRAQNDNISSCQLEWMGNWAPLN